MSRMFMRILVVTGLVSFGWVAGRAQGSQPDFEIVVRAPIGSTEVECVRGCKLAWIERAVPSSITPSSTTFNYGCGGRDTSPSPCSSGRIGGWIAR